MQNEEWPKPPGMAAGRRCSHGKWVRFSFRFRTRRAYVVMVIEQFRITRWVRLVIFIFEGSLERMKRGKCRIKKSDPLRCAPRPGGIPPPRIGWNRLALIRNQALTKAKVGCAGCVGEDNGSSGPSSVATLRRAGNMPEARYVARAGCTGMADIPAIPKILRSRFHRSFLPSFCRSGYNTGVKFENESWESVTF